MAAATETGKPEGVLAQDFKLLTLTDGETYTTNLSTIEAVFTSWNEDLSAVSGSAYPIDLSWSGRVITFNAPGVTDKKLAVFVVGRL